MRALSIAIILLSAGCVQFTQERQTVTYLRSENRINVLASPPRFGGAARLDKRDLLVHIESIRQCRVSAVPVYVVHRWRDRVVRQGGVDVIRAPDVDEGEHLLDGVPTSVRVESCDGHPAGDVRVDLALDQFHAFAVTSRSGDARFSLAAVSESDLNARPRVSAGGVTIDVTVEGGFAADALTMLVHDPESRIARERRDEFEAAVRVASRALGDGDLATAQAILERTPETARALAQQPQIRDALHKVIREGAIAILTQKVTSRTALRFCTARKILVQVHGDGVWNDLMRDLGARGAELFGGQAAELARRLDLACAAE